MGVFCFGVSLRGVRGVKTHRGHNDARAQKKKPFNEAAFKMVVGGVGVACGCVLGVREPYFYSMVLVVCGRGGGGGNIIDRSQVKLWVLQNSG